MVVRYKSGFPARIFFVEASGFRLQVLHADTAYESVTRTRRLSTGTREEQDSLCGHPYLMPYLLDVTAKLGVSSRAAAVAQAVRLDLL